jgi:hypothetical protein
MDVVLLPRPVGCLWIPLQIMTLGLVTLLLRSAEGKFPRRMDDQGVETRSGKRIGWAEVVTVQKLRHAMGPKAIAEELIFSSRKGRFSIHSRRLANYEDLAQYALRRVSPAAVGRGR